MSKHSITTVWTNGKAFRKYTGQDKYDYLSRHTPEKGFGKKIAVVVPPESIIGQEERDGMTEIKIYIPS